MSACGFVCMCDCVCVCACVFPHLPKQYPFFTLLLYLFYLSLCLASHQHCPAHGCGSKISVNLRWCESSHLVLFQDPFGSPRSFAFPHEFQNQLLRFYPEARWGADATAWGLRVHRGVCLSLTEDPPLLTSHPPVCSFCHGPACVLK